MSQIELIKTYIEGLDKELGGGIPRGHIILVAGTPGTMKSSFVFSIMYNNWKQHKHKGVYISVEESKNSLQQGMTQLGMGDFNDEELAIVDLGKLRLDYKILEETGNWLSVLKEHLQLRVKQEGVRFLAIDSLTALCSITELKNARQELFHFFGYLKSLGTTIFLITEITPPFGSYGQYNEDFLADGIIHLKFHDVGETESQLRLRCIKMRYVKHSHSSFALLWKEGKGFMVTPAISE